MKMKTTKKKTMMTTKTMMTMVEMTVEMLVYLCFYVSVHVLLDIVNAQLSFLIYDDLLSLSLKVYVTENVIAFFQYGQMSMYNCCTCNSIFHLLVFVV